MQAQMFAPTTRTGSAEGALIAGRFEVQAVLGQGGMGAVYRVRDVSTGRLLALKRLRANEKARHVALFEREYHTLAGLKHPNIVEVLDYGRDHEGPYYCMELLEGSDIHSKAPLPWQEVCRILRDVCAGLALIHARGLLHRDVSARNVWCCPDGQIKLIDFGTLSAFGVTSDIAGTPPYIPPEAVRGQLLDQRADLYAVGALGYWLLTGFHAYPARSLAELPEQWAHPPSHASERVSELERSDLPAPPSDLDRLIAALLTQDPAGRPDTAAEVIDRLSSIAGLELANQPVDVDSHLRSKRFVGRTRERSEAAELLTRARHGRGGSLCVEAEQGMGRTRFLAEIALEARLAGVLVVETSAALHDGAYGVAVDLALKLVNGFPEGATRAAEPFARMLGHLGPTLRERLGLSPQDLAPIPTTPGEARMRLHAALQDWFMAVASDRPLALFIDDVQSLDEASTAWLAGLARRAKTHPVLVVSALRVEDGQELGAALASLRAAGRVLQLTPLAHDETAQLLGSVFGQVPHLGRLTDCLHRLSEGIPEHTMQLAEHIVRRRIARHVDGSWVLPQEIDERSLPATRAERLAARLGNLTPRARELARALSIHGGLLSLEVCAALSDLEFRERFTALEELVREGILTGSADGYRFSHPSVRVALQEELKPEEAREAHRRLGSFLLASSELNTVDQLQAGYHLLQGSEDRTRLTPKGAKAVREAAVKLATTEHGSIAEAVPTLEGCLRLFRLAGASPHALIILLCPLAIAGYYADRRLGLCYGDEALSTLDKILGLRVARKLRPFLGRKLGLYVGLLWGALGFLFRRRKDPCVPGFRDTIAMLHYTVSTLAGAATICIDPDAGERYAEIVEPLSALGEDHASSVIHEFCRCLSGMVRDRLGEAYARWQRMLAKVESDTPIRELPEDVRVLYRAGALYACGVMECWRDDSRALEFAERLDGFGVKLYEMSGDQLRMLYYANQGNLELSEAYRAKVELHAIQRGTAWQVETWTPGAMITVHLRTYDAMRLKQCMEQLRHLSEQIPSLELYVRRVQGAYQLARGRYEAASELLEAVLNEEPLAVIGWARMHGALARAYNARGLHARAKAVCELALQRLGPADLAFTAVNLIVQIEHALALSGLGAHDAARKALEGLLAQHEPAQGPLTLGALHEALGKVASAVGDEASASRHYAEMERWYRGTRIASLVERCEQLMWQRRGLGYKAEEAAELDDEAGLSTMVLRIRHGGESKSRTAAQWVLDQLSRYSEFREGYVYLTEEGAPRLVAHVGAHAPSAPVWAWLESRLHASPAASSVTAQIDGLAVVQDPNRTVIEGVTYRYFALRAKRGAGERVIGCLLLREEPGQTIVFSFDLLRAIAARLVETSTQG